jgi:hypothetical protein
VNTGFFPLIPNYFVVEEWYSKCITPLLTVEGMNEDVDQGRYFIRVACCSSTVKGELATSDVTKDVLLVWLHLQLVLLGYLKTLNVLTIPMENTLRQSGHKHLVQLM